MKHAVVGDAGMSAGAAFDECLSVLFVILGFLGPWGFIRDVNPSVVRELGNVDVVWECFEVGVDPMRWCGARRRRVLSLLLLLVVLI